MRPYFIVKIKHGSFPSLCTGDNHGTVLDYAVIHNYVSVTNANRNSNLMTHCSKQEQKI